MLMKKTRNMKNFINKVNRIKKSIIYLLFFTILIFSNCKKDDDTPTDCGCNSEIKAIIPESSQLAGTITYKEQTQSNNYYTNKYWITYTDFNCLNCVRHMIVCNDYLITNEIIDALNSQTNVTVKFSGNLKEICEKRFDIADISYELITLTKIELQ